MKKVSGWPNKCKKSLISNKKRKIRNGSSTSQNRHQNSKWAMMSGNAPNAQCSIQCKITGAMLVKKSTGKYTTK